MNSVRIFQRVIFAFVLSVGSGVVPMAASAQLSAVQMGSSSTSSSDNPSAPVDQKSGGRSSAERAGPSAAAAQVAQPEANPSYQSTEIYTPQGVPPEMIADKNDASGAHRMVAPSEFELFASQIVGRPLRRFGANLLVPDARDFTVPATTAVPPDYRLNPGDEIILGLTGPIVANSVRLTVDAQGRIFVPRVGAVNVAGVRYNDLQSVIGARVSRQFRNFQLSVAIGRLHGITVYVTGFASQPGSYTVSSLATVVNAVLAAGGPSGGGSFRSIQLRRSGRLVSDFDLYDLLLRGDKNGDVSLQNGDVIYVAPVGAQVAVIGSVNNEAIFEAARGESVTDVLKDAGGVNTIADDTRALVLDPLRGAGFGWEELTPAQSSSRQVTRGLVVRVLPGVGIARGIQTQPVLVTVSGEVVAPGRFYLPPGTRMADVLSRAGGLTAQAFPYAAVITRESVRSLQQSSFDRALHELQLSLSLKPLVTPAYATSAPPVTDLAAVRDIVQQLSARRPDGRVVLNLPPSADRLPGDLLIENNDTIYVPPRPTTVGVFGQVNSPSSFYYEGHGTIGDFVARAGGVQRQGRKSGVFVIRANGSVIGGRGTRVFGEQALPGDLIYVPVDTLRGETWARVRDLLAVLFQGAVTAAAVNSAVN